MFVGACRCMCVSGYRCAHDEKTALLNVQKARTFDLMNQHRHNRLETEVPHGYLARGVMVSKVVPTYPFFFFLLTPIYDIVPFITNRYMYNVYVYDAGLLRIRLCKVKNNKKNHTPTESADLHATCGSHVRTGIQSLVARWLCRGLPVKGYVAEFGRNAR